MENTYLSTVGTVAKKATTSLYFLKRNLSNCPGRVKEKCYKSPVRSIIEYASSAWDPHTQCKFNRREMVQHRVANFVKGYYDRTNSVISMLTDLRWNTLRERRLQSKTLVFYKIVHQLVVIPKAPYLIPARSSRGHNMLFLLPQSTVNVHLYSFFPVS